MSSPRKRSSAERKAKSAQRQAKRRHSEKAKTVGLAYRHGIAVALDEITPPMRKRYYLRGALAASALWGAGVYAWHLWPIW